jgi:sulfite exporter TauE/SafE
MRDGTGFVLVTLLVTGLAGSLHCVGMCGPILLAFQRVFDGTRAGASGWRALARDFVPYHAGRIWTYGMLGLVAGIAGQGVRSSALRHGWQRPAGFVLGGLVVLAGLVMLGALPAPRLDAVLGGCGLSRLRRHAWFASLLERPGAGARLLLGVTMGLLPCGLVWGALLVAAALPTPLHAAAGMLVFGVGTLPSLTGVLLAGRFGGGRLRRHGPRLAAVTLLLAGCFMLWRAATVTASCHLPVVP